MHIQVCKTERVFHVGDVIRKLRKERNWTVEELAEKAGVGKMTVSSIERGEANYRRETVEKIAAALDTSTARLEVQASPSEELLFADLSKQPMLSHPMYSGVDFNAPLPPRHVSSQRDIQFVSLPLLTQPIAAGAPIEIDGEVNDELAFRNDFVRRFVEPLCLRVGSDQFSMVPTVLPGDVVVIDRDEQKRLRPVNDSIYALNLDGGGTLKRVEIVHDVLVISSDNQDKNAYPSITRDLTDIDLLKVIIGEVVWQARYFGSGKRF